MLMKKVSAAQLSTSPTDPLPNRPRRQRLLALGLMALIGMPHAAALADQFPDLVTVTAFDHDSRKIWGMAYGLPVGWGSDQIAIEHCQMRGGKDCRIWVSNLNSCIAVAGPENPAEPELFYGGGGSLFNPDQRQTAIDAAIGVCRQTLGKSCTIREVGCGVDEMPDHDDEKKAKPKSKAKAE